MDLSPTTKNTEFGHINPENNEYIFNTSSEKHNYFIWIQGEFPHPQNGCWTQKKKIF